ncbi:C1 family peptidase [Insolitispirillum peregrinum]|uniref:Papain family cysteine protease n=1 Tax=Insolitispirillum peregrinum TaxID=80876 RepID=A0A1N7NI99_9PROT|nr:C1 family peptidase [Insolitispirillum peregrinum]SIS98153.1 Papain family cysteine protease [Insolitispirillum peregrinum]
MPIATSQKTSHPVTVGGRKVNALPDVPDIRDRYYEPSLIPLKRSVGPLKAPVILDQGRDGACTGFALAAVINLLLAERARLADEDGCETVSPWMLYDMARRHDEWPGEDYDGSSLRGALRGWYNNGACRFSLWPQPQSGVSVEQAKDARSVALGAYYRLRANLSDFHAALNECQTILVSAAVHDGWETPEVHGERAVIAAGQTQLGYHAFAVVGYDADGFWVQNSWGQEWGKGGVALWSYEDWAANVQDAWVVRLALPTPQVFGLSNRNNSSGPVGLWGRSAPTRNDIAGHFVHIDDGTFCARQPYWSTAQDVAETAGLIARRFAEDGRYQHLLIYAHGGLNSPDSCAERIRAMTPVFMANGIYPYAVMYDTGFAETLKDIIVAAATRTNDRAGASFDRTDMLIEQAVSGVGGAMWREMKRNARQMFETDGAGSATLAAFLIALKPLFQQDKIKLHVIGHSLGSVLVGHLLESLLTGPDGAIPVSSCSLMAPACRVDFFREYYGKMAGLDGATPSRIENFAIYNLSDALEQADNVGLIYRKSLLYLVSNAFEGARGTPLAGMAETPDELGLKVGGLHIADAASSVTRSRSHGGFDNDPVTMNHILRRILGGASPVREFTARDLDY